MNVGDKIVIVYLNTNFALGNTQNGYYRSGAYVTKLINNRIKTGDDVQIITLEKGYSDDSFAFLLSDDDSKKYLSSSETDDGLLEIHKINASSSWRIYLDDLDSLIIKSQGSGYYLYLDADEYDNKFCCIEDPIVSFTIYKLCYVVDDGTLDTPEELEEPVIPDVPNTPNLPYWKRFSLSDSLSIGDKIIIYNYSAKRALGVVQKDNYRLGVSCIDSDDGSMFGGASYIEYNDSIQTITLEKGVIEGTFAFNVGIGDDKLYLSSINGQEGLITSNTLNEFSSWSLTLDIFGNVTLSQQINNEFRVFYYNPLWGEKYFTFGEKTGSSDNDSINIYKYYES